MTATVKVDMQALLKEVAAVLAQNGLRPDLQDGLHLTCERLDHITKLLDISDLQRYDGYCGEGGGIWRDNDGDYIDIDDVRERHKLVQAQLQNS